MGGSKTIQTFFIMPVDKISCSAAVNQTYISK